MVKQRDVNDAQNYISPDILKNYAREKAIFMFKPA